MSATEVNSLGGKDLACNAHADATVMFTATAFLQMT